MPSSSLRPARPADLDGIRALLDRCDLPSGDLTPAHLSPFWVMPGSGDAPDGCVGLEPTADGTLLRSLAVRPGRRGEGLGRRLLHAAEAWGRREETGPLYLLTTTAADYFRRHGYEAVARAALPASIRQTEEAARLCPDSATCMRKALTGPDPAAARASERGGR